MAINPQAAASHLTAIEDELAATHRRLALYERDSKATHGSLMRENAEMAELVRHTKEGAQKARAEAADARKELADALARDEANRRMAEKLAADLVEANSHLEHERSTSAKLRARLARHAAIVNEGTE
jgi:hypothetical protein